jgi:hypothetical protein
MLNHHADQVGFIDDELLQLEERPIVLILPGIRFGSVTLPGTRTETRQVFKTNVRMAVLCESNDVLGKAVVNMCHHAALSPFELLDGAVFPRRLQFLAPRSLGSTYMADTSGFPEHDWTIRRGSGQWNILSPVNPYPAACGLSIGNLHRHRETGIPDALAGTPKLDRARRGAAIKHRIQPALVCSMMDGQRNTLRHATSKPEGD